MENYIKKSYISRIWCQHTKRISSRIGIARITLVIVIIVIVVAGAGGGIAYSYITSNQNQSWHLNIYAAGLESEWNTVLQTFQKQYPQLKSYTLTVLSAGAIAQKFLTEESSGKYVADAIEIGAAPLQDAINQGLVQQYTLPSSPLTQDPTVQKYSFDGYYPVHVLIVGIGIETQMIPVDSITSFANLTQPSFVSKFSGKVGIYDPRTTVSVEAVYDYNATYGPAFLKNLTSLNPILYAKGNLATSALAAGKIAAVIFATDFTYDSTAAAGLPISYVWPSEGSDVIGTYMAIPKHTGDSSVAAKTFVTWLYSKTGQEAIRDAGVATPSYPGLSLPGLKPLNGIATLHDNITAYLATPSQSILTYWNQVTGLPG